MKADKQLALKVANDIAEDIDCGETRNQLRACIAWWANHANSKANIKAELRLTELQLKLKNLELFERQLRKANTVVKGKQI